MVVDPERRPHRRVRVQVGEERLGLALPGPFELARLVVGERRVDRHPGGHLAGEPGLHRRERVAVEEPAGRLLDQEGLQAGPVPQRGGGDRPAQVAQRLGGGAAAVHQLAGEVPQRRVEHRHQAGQGRPGVLVRGRDGAGQPGDGVVLGVEQSAHDVDRRRGVAEVEHEVRAVGRVHHLAGGRRDGGAPQPRPGGQPDRGHQRAGVDEPGHVVVGGRHHAGDPRGQHDVQDVAAPRRDEQHPLRLVAGDGGQRERRVQGGVDRAEVVVARPSGPTTRRRRRPGRRRRGGPAPGSGPAGRRPASCPQRAVRSAGCGRPRSERTAGRDHRARIP